MKEGWGSSLFWWLVYCLWSRNEVICLEQRGSELKRGLNSAIATMENERERDDKGNGEGLPGSIEGPFEVGDHKFRVAPVIYSGTNLGRFPAVLSNRRWAIIEFIQSWCFARVGGNTRARLLVTGGWSDKKWYLCWIGKEVKTEGASKVTPQTHLF